MERDPETKALPFVALLVSIAQQYIAQKAEGSSAREGLSARRERGQG